MVKEYKRFLVGNNSFIIYKVMEHYEVYVNGFFLGSGDNLNEIEEEIDDYLAENDDYNA